VVSEFAEAIAHRRAPLTDGRSGLWVLEVLEAAQRSLRHGGVPAPLAHDATAAMAGRSA